MKSLFFTLVFFLFSFVSVFGQDPQQGGGPPGEDDSENKGGINRKFSEPKEKQKRAPIDLYKIISVERDTIFLDTTLSIQKEYKFNYLRKDNFELERFSNVGRPYTQLAKQEKQFSIIPQFGASVRHLGYLEVEDIYYYQVPTPLSDLFYKTALEQGQQLDAFVTLNPKKNFNISVGYKGVRSLGIYQNTLTSTKAFRGMLSYSTPNNRYVSNFHFTDQRLLSQENGGLTDDGEEQFFSGTDDDIDDRSILEVNFEDAENLLDGKRLYLNHEYRIAKPDTTGVSKLAVNHEFNYFVKKWYFSQTDPDEDFFGAAQTEDEFTDRVELNVIQNKLQVNLQNQTLGKLGVFARHTYHNYGYDTVYATAQFDDDDEITGYEIAVDDRLIGETLSLGANYKNTYKGFLLEGNAEATIIGDYSNQFFKGTAGYNYKDKFAAKFGYSIRSEAVSFNKQLYQSNYIDYIYENDFDNTLTNTFFGTINFEKDFWIEASLSFIHNYAYFEGVTPSVDENEVDDDDEDDDDDDDDEDEDDEYVVSSAVQESGVIGLLKIKAYKEFALGNFRLANTLMFQHVEAETENLYNVPQFVTRNSFYYQNEVFKRAMFLQVGFNFKYFTNFYADGYDPLLSENYVQTSQKIGNYPQLDFFLNSKVRQTRIFFKLENLQSAFEQNEELVAPGYASRDFLIRFGLVWNFFL